MKQIYLNTFLLLACFFSAFSQAPNIRYQTPQVYTTNSIIAVLAPTNTGGGVPATTYGQVTTFAGSGTIGYADGVGTAASFSAPARATFDANGNMFVVDRDNSAIRKITPAGVVSTFVIGGLSQPNGITMDAAGTIYIADASSNSVKKITSTGVITFYAGGSQGSNNGTSTAARFYYPFGITISATGDALYVADTYNSMIRKVTIPGAVVTTVAGTGFPGFSNGTGTAANLNNPNCVKTDAAGNLFVSDANNYVVRKISPAGLVTTFAGTGVQGSTNGTTSTATFKNLGGVALDEVTGTMYVADLGNSLIRKIDAAGNVSTLAGTGVQGAVNGIGTAASFNHPNDVQVGSSGYVYVTDYGNNLIRKICVTGYTIDKPLPAGLVFDPTTGIISGRPTVISPSTNYTVTAYNINGSSSAVINITVNAAPVIPPPNISYQTPQVYKVKTTITPLAPVNTGSAVPATIYAQTSTFTGPGLNGSANNVLVGTDITIDATGNLYTTDFLNNIIRKISPGGLITTLAGSGLQGSTDGTGTAAGFYNPAGIAVDAAGNLYVADQNNNKIRKITPAGVVTTFAGTGTRGSTNGTGTAASFNGPNGLTIDALGNLYVTDQFSNRIRKVTPAGVVTTVAGTGASGAANGTLTTATFYSPTGIAIDAAGNLYVADSGNNLIRMISTAGVVTTYAGSGVAGYVNGAALSASFNGPTRIAIDNLGTLFITDSGNNLIRMINPLGIVSTLAGSGPGSVGSPAAAAGTLADFNSPYGMVLDGQGNMYITANGIGNNLVKKIILTGYSIDKALPSGLSLDPATGIISGTPLAPTPAVDYTVTAHNIYGNSNALVNIKVNDIAHVSAPNISYQTPKVYTVGSIIPALNSINTGGTVPANVYRQVTTYAGNGTAALTDGPAAAASFVSPRSTTVDAYGNVYVADQQSNRIRKISPAGVVSTFAGNNAAKYADGTGYAASFYSPAAVTADGCGNIFVADYANSVVRSITPTGVAGLLAGSGALGTTNGTGSVASFTRPSFVSIDADFNIYETENTTNQIRKITPAGVVTTFAGTIVAGSGNGSALTASFNLPAGTAFDAAGNMYVADFGNNQIRKISPAGVVSTFAGSGAQGAADGPAANSTFNNPAGLTVDGAGNVYVADQGNSLIRMITPAGVVSTLAGNSGRTRTDNIGTAASFNTPTGISIDASGNLYVADFFNYVVRKISTSGYTIDKTLPPGLVFDNTTGNISGTPTAPSPATDYTITAYNVSGNSVTTVNIKVNDVTPPVAPPNISYQTPQVYTVNNTITPLAPTNTGGAVVGNGYGQVTTIAGNGPNGTKNGNANGAALTASFNNPFSTVEDAVGNIYVADFGNNLIRKITPAGVVSTFAGGGTGHADGVGTAASFSGPYGMAIDASGNIYVADYYNNIIRKITPVAVVTTIAGTAGVSGYTDANGAAAKFGQPWALTIDGAGNLYITDQVYHSIRKMDAAGNVTTFAGRSGTAGSNDGIGTAASFYYPKGLATDAAGNVYVADSYNNLIRKITPSGVVTTIAGAGTAGSVNGVGLAAKFNNPTGIAVDAVGNLYVNDESNSLIRMINTGGIVSTLAGSGNVISIDGTGAGASFFRPSSISIDAQRNLYVTELNVIRKISMFGYVIDKPLPPGLSFDPATGIISGTPTSPSPATNYTITAYNAGGSSSAVVNITVLDLPGQTITFNPLTSVVYGTPDFSVAATSDNGTIPITYTSSNPAAATITADGKTVHIISTGQTIITASQAGSTNYKAATPVSQTLTVTPAPLTITADNKSRTYGAANPPFTFTYTGFVYGETPAVLTAAPAAATTAMLTSPAGNYPITLSGAAAANYSITYVNGTLTVTQAQLTITADNQTRTYGVANPTLTLTYTGFLNGDDATKLTTQATVTTTAVITSPVGQYPISVSGAAVGNYTINYVNGVLTVTARPIIFNTLATKTTCDLDFDPGATGGNAAITYTSSNTSVATIVGGKVHLVSQGTTVITATDGITSVQQTLTVGLPNSAGLHIAVDTKEVCAGMPITFTATFDAPISNAIYSWIVNDIAVLVSNSNIFTFAPLKSNDAVYCHVEVPGLCFSGETATISTFIINPYLTPTITIIPDKASPICSGTAVTFTASTSNGGSNPSYQWQVNGVNAGTNNSTFTSNAFADGDMVTCTLTSSGGKCLTTSTVTSIPSTVTIKQAPLAQVIVTASANSVFQGNDVTFTAAVSPAVTVTNYQWLVNGINAGTNSATFTSNTLNNNDVITCRVTVNTGCTFNLTGGDFRITILPLPVVIIPNTFTPNGDAINDTWELKNLEFYPNATVRIFNRAGTTVFTSASGYPIPWDGRYNNTVLPVGTYYYIIDLKRSNLKMLSGSVNLIK